MAVLRSPSSNVVVQMSPYNETPASQISLVIQADVEFENSSQTESQTQTQLELTQQTQTQLEQLTPDESSNLCFTPNKSPMTALPWGRLVPSAPGVQSPVDFASNKKEYILGRSTAKADVPILVATKKNSAWSKKEATMMAWAHSMISNKHSKIFLSAENNVMIEDTSGNGTFINQTTHLTKDQQRILHSGDEICLVNPFTLKKKISSQRVLQSVIQQYTFIFIQSKPPQRRSCVNPRAMHYKPRQSSSTPNSSLTSSRNIESLYELREKIGDGTSGQVRRVIHRQTGREYAVKIISLRRNLDTKQMEEEVNLMRTLDHPYIVQLVDVFVHQGVAMYLVMELVSGGDLFDRIVQHERYSQVNAKRAMRRLLSAVYYLHEKCNIVHRDLKPENILCCSEFQVKLADFGLAKIVKSDGLKTFCGTPQYFAPEVLQRRHTVTGEGRYGKPADMWSLGVILYILLVGKPPFGNIDFMENADYELNFEGEELWSSMPLAKDLVQSLLQLDPKKRLSVRQACDHAWINLDDGDTHVHPLDDPAVTGRKRLSFDEEKKEEHELLQTAVREHSFMQVEEPTAANLFQDAIGDAQQNNKKEPSLPNLAKFKVSSTLKLEAKSAEKDATMEQEEETDKTATVAVQDVAVQDTGSPNTPEASTSPNEASSSSTPISNLNQRGNQFRNHVLDASKTPNASNIRKDQGDIEQFSQSDHESLESFPETPSKNKRSLEEHQDEETEDSSNKKQRTTCQKSTRQTTLSSWFVAKNSVVSNNNSNN